MQRRRCDGSLVAASANSTSSRRAERPSTATADASEQAAGPLAATNLLQAGVTLARNDGVGRLQAAVADDAGSRVFQPPAQTRIVHSGRARPTHSRRSALRPTLAFRHPPQLGSPRSSSGGTVGGSAAAAPPPLTSTTFETVRCCLHLGLSEAFSPVLLPLSAWLAPCLPQAAVSAPTGDGPPPLSQPKRTKISKPMLLILTQHFGPRRPRPTLHTAQHARRPPRRPSSSTRPVPPPRPPPRPAESEPLPSFEERQALAQ